MQNKEVWKPIPGYDGYEASTYGQIRSLDRPVFMGPVGTVIKKGIILKQRVYDGGYVRTKVSTGSALVHRLVALAFHENIDNKKTVNHIDGNKLNNSSLNLEWATYSENSYHAVTNGLRITPHGEKSHSAKLTEKQVLDIKKILSTKRYTHVQIGEIFGVKKSAIGYINTGKNWKHLNISTQ